MRPVPASAPAASKIGNEGIGSPICSSKHPCEQNDVAVMNEKFEGPVHDFWLEPLSRICLVTDAAGGARFQLLYRAYLARK